MYLCIPIFLELALSSLTSRQTVGQKAVPIGAERITQLFHHIHRVLTDVAMFPLFHLKPPLFDRDENDEDQLKRKKEEKKKKKIHRVLTDVAMFPLFHLKPPLF